MRELILSKETAIWLLLTAITFFSWAVGTHHGMLFADHFIESSAILILAFFKARLVIIHFMEVGHAPATLRVSCESWVLFSCVGLLLANSGQLSL